MSSRNSASASTGLIFLRLEALDELIAADIGIKTAAKDVQVHGIENSSGAADISGSVGNHITRRGDLYHAVGDLLAKLDGVRKVIDSISEVRSRV